MAGTTKKAAARARPAAEADAEGQVRSTIAAMPEEDRAIAERPHAVIRASAPELTPKLWYGQPAYAKDGEVVCSFRGAEVDQERYLTLVSSGEANLHDGSMWPTAYAVTGLTASDERRVAQLVERAAG